MFLECLIIPLSKGNFLASMMVKSLHTILLNPQISTIPPCIHIINDTNRQKNTQLNWHTGKCKQEILHKWPSLEKKKGGDLCIDYPTHRLWQPVLKRMIIWVYAFPMWPG